MNDRFKFRVWNIEQKKYEDLTRTDVLYLIDTNGQLNRVIVYGPSNDIPCDTHFFTKPLEKYFKVEFCTGLRDKNGKLIFEGDIVKLTNTKECETQIRVVIYKDCAFQFNLQNSMQIDKPLYCWAINYLNHYKHIELEIIGNIYENKELVEG